MNECGKSWNKVCRLEMCSEHVDVRAREGWLDSDCYDFAITLLSYRTVIL